MVIKVFTAPSVVPCDLLKALLDAEGIPSFIQNQHGTGLLGYGLPVAGGSALSWAWPEVWISEDDIHQARPIIDQIQESWRDR